MSFINDRPNALFWLNWLQASMLTDRSGDVEDRKIILLMNFHLMWQFEINLRWRRWVILCVLLDIGYLSLLWVKKKIQCQVHVYNSYLLYSFRYATLIQRTKITYRKHTVLRETLMYCSKLLN